MSNAMNKRRRSTEIEARRKTAVALYLAGHSQSEIGERLDVSKATVSKDIAAVRAEWLEDAIEDVSELTRLELARLAQAEKNAWIGWKRSLRDARVVRTETGGDEGEKTVVTVSGQAGDPRHLQIVLKCIERRCQLLGLDRPERIEIEETTTCKILEDEDWYGTADKVRAIEESKQQTETDGNE